jgi:hypothetical protein
MLMLETTRAVEKEVEGRMSRMSTSSGVSAAEDDVECAGDAEAAALDCFHGGGLSVSASASTSRALNFVRSSVDELALGLTDDEEEEGRGRDALEESAPLSLAERLRWLREWEADDEGEAPGAIFLGTEVAFAAGVGGTPRRPI